LFEEGLFRAGAFKEGAEFRCERQLFIFRRRLYTAVNRKHHL
jgi:hypothetical protein